MFLEKACVHKAWKQSLSERWWQFWSACPFWLPDWDKNVILDSCRLVCKKDFVLRKRFSGILSLRGRKSSPTLVLNVTDSRTTNKIWSVRVHVFWITMPNFYNFRSTSNDLSIYFRWAYTDISLAKCPWHRYRLLLTIYSTSFFHAPVLFQCSLYMYRVTISITFGYYIQLIGQAWLFLTVKPLRHSTIMGRWL